MAGQVNNRAWGELQGIRGCVSFLSYRVFFLGVHSCLAKLFFRISTTGKQKRKVGVLEVPLNSFR